VITAATYDSTGQKKLYYECAYCHHAFTNLKTIPMKTRSESSSGSGGSSGSFGGGRLGGGGAGGSY